MTENDYKNIISGIVPNEDMRIRLRQKTLSFISRPKTRRRAVLKKGILSAAACALVLIGAAAGTFFWHSTMLMNTPSFSGFVLTAYAAGKPGSSVPGQKSDAIQLVPKKELRFQYSPIMNQVPGFPLTLGCREATKKTTAADRIRITADSGSILLWNQADVRDAGKTYECAPGTTIYWSPDLNAPGKKLTILTLTAFKGNREIGTQELHIQALGGGTAYSVVMQ